MDSTFSQIGGARLDWMNVTIPYARLSGDGNSLRLSCSGRDHVFHSSNIESLSRYRMFSIGLRIEHTVPTYPRFVVFWVSPFPWGRGFSMLKEKLERLGYSVQV